MGLFDVDFKVLNKIQTPERLRQPKRMAWFNVLTSPCSYLYNLFMTNRYNNLYILNHSSQVTYMQAVLNDAFDNALRRIVIIDGPDDEPIYTYVVPELKPVALYTVTEAHPDTLYTGAETVLYGPDFIVQVPHSITFDTVYMKALIDKFRLASKNTYTIQLV